MVINTYLDLFIVQLNSTVYDSNKHCFGEFHCLIGICGKFCSKNFALTDKYEMKLPYSFLS